MYDSAALPGFIAADPGVLDAVFPEDRRVDRTTCGPVTLATWSLEAAPGGDRTLPLSRVVRTAHGRVDDRRLMRTMRGDPRELAVLLPPFAAVAGDERGVVMVADAMGFRQLFHSDPAASGPPVLSTSAMLAARVRAAGLDEAAWGVQSLLGWQLGQRTLFGGVTKLEPGAAARLCADVEIAAAAADDEAPVTLEEAVEKAAALLRTSLNVLLDEQPDAVLQLTGGMDSRVLLSAVDVSRRRGLRAMTLGLPGHGDVDIAAGLAARYGLRHEVHGLADLETVEAGDAWDACRAAAVELDGMSDPVALAALGFGERSFDQGVRISGLGGEVARGFYYVGQVDTRAVTERQAAQLAAWRMFANESVEDGMLEEDFAAWAHEVAISEVLAGLRGDDWFRATDSLYLRQRMQRWAGATDTAVAYRRVVVNPMLDHEFIGLAQRLDPRDKANSRFLASLQVRLDPELGQIPLEGRLAPIAYARPQRSQAAAKAALTGRKFVHKALQRLRGANRAPAGGRVLSEKVVEHWRSHPQLLEPASHVRFVKPEWIEGVVAGRIHPRPSSVAFLTNLIVATSPSG
jgi:asparagine synthase (glutamine-hydrolysing)